MNPYLKRLRDQYEALQTSMKGLQDKAVAENRDLTEVELRSVQEQSEAAKGLYTQIELLTEGETRTAQVRTMAAAVATATGQDGQGDQGDQGDAAANTGGAHTRGRDPGHYRSLAQGGRHSFFADLYRARGLGDDAAAKRLLEHTRALDTGNHGAGIVPPKWLLDEFQGIPRQGRILANAVRNIPLGDDPRPITLPKQTAGASSSSLAEQAAENDPIINTDFFDTDVDTVTPKPTAGKTIVARQMLDMASPAIDSLIYGDLVEAYNDILEAKVGTAVINAGVAAGVVTTFATEALFNGTLPAVPAADAVIDLALAVRSARKRPATLLAMTVRRWGKFKKLRDAEGRPLIPGSSAGPVNVVGVGSVQTDGVLEDLPVVVTDALGTTAYPEYFAALRASDTLLFESNMMRFRYEEPLGPESIILGIWAYTAVIVRHATTSVRVAKVTAAT